MSDDEFDLFALHEFFQQQQYIGMFLGQHFDGVALYFNIGFVGWMLVEKLQDREKRFPDDPSFNFIIAGDILKVKVKHADRIFFLNGRNGGVRKKRCGKKQENAQQEWVLR